MLSRQQSLWRRQRASSSTSSPADEAKADETRQGDDHELGGAVRERERRCWVCFEEDKDGSRRGEWRRPCPCNLEAHESCLVSWVNFSGRAVSRRQVLDTLLITLGRNAHSVASLTAY